MMQRTPEVVCLAARHIEQRLGLAYITCAASTRAYAQTTLNALPSSNGLADLETLG
jgi:hypothetical protein